LRSGSCHHWSCYGLHLYLAWLESGLVWLHSWGCAWLQASWGCYGNGGLGRFCMRSHKLRFVNYQPLQLGICLGSAVYFQWWTLLTLLEICKYYLPSSVRTHSTLLWYSPGSNKIRLHCNSCWENSGLLDPWSCHMLLSWYTHKERYLVSMQPIISLGTGASAEVDLDLVGIHLYIFWHVVSRSMSIETSY